MARGRCLLESSDLTRLGGWCCLLLRPQLGLSVRTPSPRDLGFLTAWVTGSRSCWFPGAWAWKVVQVHLYHILLVKEVIRICLGSRERDRSLPLLLSGRNLKVTLEEQVEWKILLWSSLQNRTCHTSEAESCPPCHPIWLILWSNILNYLWEMQRGILGHISGTREIPESTECKLNNYKHSLSISKAHAELSKKYNWNSGCLQKLIKMMYVDINFWLLPKTQCSSLAVYFYFFICESVH